MLPGGSVEREDECLRGVDADRDRRTLFREEDARHERPQRFGETVHGEPEMTAAAEQAGVDNARRGTSRLADAQSLRSDEDAGARRLRKAPGIDQLRAASR